MLGNWTGILLTLALGTAVAGTLVAWTERPEDVPAAASAQRTRVVDAETIKLQKAAIIAAAGHNVVANIEAARDRLAAGNQVGAARFVTAAVRILKQMRNALTLEPHAPPAGSRLRIPLWAQITLTREQDMNDQLRARLAQITPYALRGEHDEVLLRLEETGVHLTYSYIDLPLDATLARVKAAAGALQDGDASKALQALNAAADGLAVTAIPIGTSGGRAQPPPAGT